MVLFIFILFLFLIFTFIFVNVLHEDRLLSDKQYRIYTTIIIILCLIIYRQINLNTY